LLALEAGKHVLVEKPVACRAEDGVVMVARAREKELLFLEGMWTRFFPVVEMARYLISSGAIGRVVALHADFGAFRGGERIVGI
jgi:predicted dehydrogenase